MHVVLDYTKECRTLSIATDFLKNCIVWNQEKCVNFVITQSVALTSHFVKHDHVNLFCALFLPWFTKTFLMKTEKFINITDRERNEPYHQDFNHILLINAWDIGTSSTAILPERCLWTWPGLILSVVKTISSTVIR